MDKKFRKVPIVPVGSEICFSHISFLIAIHGQFKGKIYLTLASSNSLETENVTDSEEIIRELQLQLVQHREEIKRYQSQLEAKDTQIEIYKKHNQTLEKIILALSTKQIHKIDIFTMSEAEKFEEKGKNVIYNLVGSKISNIGDIGGDFNPVSNNIFRDYIHFERKPSLAEAAKEIQELLEQLEGTYSQNKTAQEITNAEKMTLALRVIEQIKSDQTLKQKVIKALEPGETEALSELLNHPAGQFITAAIEDLQSTNES